MYRMLVLSLALAACGVESEMDAMALATDAVAPPTVSLNLSATPMWIGETVQFEVDGLRANTHFILFAADKQRAGAPQLCPDFLDGCMGLYGQLFRVAAGDADDQGHAILERTVPEDAVPADIDLQVISIDGSGFVLSQVLQETLLDAEVEDQDGDGLMDYDELNVHGSDPMLADSDGDGIDDDEELAAGTL